MIWETRRTLPNDQGTNIYAPNTGALQYIRQMLTAIKWEIKNKIIADNFNALLSELDRSSRQKNQ